VPIDCVLAEGQRQLQQAAGEFAENVLRPVAEQIDRSAEAWDAFLGSRRAFGQLAQARFTKVFDSITDGGRGAKKLITESRPRAKPDLIEAFSWTGSVLAASSVDTTRAVLGHALNFARTDMQLGKVAVIDDQNVGLMQELSITASVFCSQAGASRFWDGMRLVGMTSCTQTLPLGSLMRDTSEFPLYDRVNLGIRRRQLQDLLREPDCDPLTAALADAALGT
jgi:hypothetical protein